MWVTSCYTSDTSVSFMSVQHLFVLQGEHMANHLSESVPEQTFQYQSSLPPLPVPSLESSLSKYLDSGGALVLCNMLCHTVSGFVNVYHGKFKYLFKQILLMEQLIAACF